MKIKVIPCLIKSVASQDEPIVEIALDKYPKEVYFSEDVYEIISFLRDLDRNYCTIAFKSEEELTIKVLDDKVNINLDSRFYNNYYYIYPIYQHNKDHIFSQQIASRSGFIKLKFENKNNDSIEKTLIINPSLSKKDYDSMLLDLYNISIQLLCEEKSIIHHNFIYNNHELDKLEQRINLLKDYLKAMLKHPSSTLTKKYTTANVNKIKKFDSKVLNSIYNSTTNRALSICYEEEYSILEHKMIKNYLITLKKYCEYLYNKYTFNQEILDKNTTNSNYIKGKNGANNENFYANLTKQKELLEENKTLCIKAQNKISYLKQKINKLINYSIFNGLDGTILISATHLFLHHPIYKKIYNLIKKDMNILNAFNSIDINTLRINKQSDLYEKWCFIKIIYIFCIEYGFEIISAEHGKNHIIKTLLNKGKLEENVITFKWSSNSGLLTESNIYIKLGYNCTFDKSRLRPDFYMQIYSNDTDDNSYYIFDSKYRDYNYNSIWYDVLGVCAEKYIYKLQTIDQINVMSAFILHSDINKYDLNLGNNLGDKLISTNLEEDSEYNIKYLKSPNDTINFYKNCDLPNNKFGYTRFLPSNYTGFKEIFRMIIEYHTTCINSLRTKFFSKCWICGSDDLYIERKYTTGLFFKYHITCNKCKEFWVKNHCFCCHEDLVKHAKNYLIEMDDKWYLKCPYCQS